jgi:hypothetical protein
VWGRGGVGVGVVSVFCVCVCVPRVCVCVFCVCVCVFRACVGLRVCGWGVWRAACVGRGKVEQVCVCVLVVCFRLGWVVGAGGGAWAGVRGREGRVGRRVGGGAGVGGAVSGVWGAPIGFCGVKVRGVVGGVDAGAPAGLRVLGAAGCVLVQFEVEKCQLGAGWHTLF